ncbi:MAG: TraB/GumN family protein [Candidatus Competibacteraceae bacterium]|nr:TraB/GumN family protein [Candidatus Competibacteraceae bacterium]
MPLPILAPLLALLLLAPALQAAQGPPLWKARVDGATVYLLGTIHFGRPQMYPLSPGVEQALREADVLVVELDVRRDMLTMAGAMLQAGLYQGGRTLKDALGPRDWKRLEDHLSAMGMPPQLFLPQKPWMVALALTALELQRQGFSEELGVERYLLDKAGPTTRVVELESLEEQLELFERMGEEGQLAMLRETLIQLQDDRTLERMLEAWRQGDGARLEGLMAEGFGPSAAGRRAHELMITQRNRTMTRRLLELVEPGQTYLLAVGAGHLPGEEGIIAALRRRGYPVEREPQGPQ